MSKPRPNVSEVFTPRSSEVNSAMYIDRPEHERALARSVEGGLHTFVCGESGSGKSWLTRRVATDRNWVVHYANAANAVRRGSLTQTIHDAVVQEGAQELTEYSQTLGGEVGALGFGGSAEAERKYSVKSKERLLSAFGTARERAKNKKVVLIIDNLEAIFQKPALMEELGNIILLLDDPDYAKCGVKILIIGVPSDIVEYYQKIENMETISNRIQEVPAVRSLDSNQITEFVQRGFVKQLRMEFSETNIRMISNHVEYVTLGIAQRLHEYCQTLGHCIEDNGWFFNFQLLQEADANYLIASMKKSYAVVDSFMNEKKSKTGRRNQLLYSLSKVSSVEFDPGKVEWILRQSFPETTKGKTLAVGQMMADISTGHSPLLRRGTKGSVYRFADPRYLMCLRLMLKVAPAGEQVVKVPLAR